jgi:predicted enzyme related to lactoylglutathione lyase
LAGFIIDCQTDDLDSAAAFWSAALGYPIDPHENPAEDAYVHLDTTPTELHIEVQKVNHPSRVHLDIESDDIPAEVARLEALGATRLSEIKSWVVMEAPTGQRFCVVRKQNPGFDESAHYWS